MLTTTEAALFLKEQRGIIVEGDTVKHWCLQGRFPNARKVGGVRRGIWMIPEQDLLDLTLPTMGRPPQKDDTQEA